MSKALSKKLAEVTEEHYTEVIDQNVERFREGQRDRAIEFRGALKAVGNLAGNLQSHYIAGWIRVEDEKSYLHWGYKTFAECLSSDEFPDISKSSFYRIKELFLSEGTQLFDLFSGARIPAKARKLLAEKNIEIKLEDSELVIGDQRVPVADTSAVKELFNTVYDALRERDVREEAKDKKIEKLESQLEQGKADYDELRRATEANSESTPYSRALLGSVSALIALSEQIKESDPAEMAARAEDDLKLIAGQYFRLTEAYGVNVPLADTTAIDDDDPIKAIAGDNWDMD